MHGHLGLCSFGALLGWSYQSTSRSFNACQWQRRTQRDDSWKHKETMGKPKSIQKHTGSLVEILQVHTSDQNDGVNPPGCRKANRWIKLYTGELGRRSEKVLLSSRGKSAWWKWRSTNGGSLRSRASLALVKPKSTYQSIPERWSKRAHPHQ